jgi:hypothetical protein
MLLGVLIASKRHEFGGTVAREVTHRKRCGYQTQDHAVDDRVTLTVCEKNKDSRVESPRQDAAQIRRQIVISVNITNS